MAKSLRSQKRKAKKRDIKAKVFGPAFDARISRLSEKLAAPIDSSTDSLTEMIVENPNGHSQQMIVDDAADRSVKTTASKVKVGPKHARQHKRKKSSKRKQIGTRKKR